MRQFKTNLVRTAMPNTISHETVHWMKRNAPKQYQALEDMVLAALKNANDYDFSAAVKKEYGKYKEKHGQDIDDPTAREEIVARACEDLFGRSEVIRQFLADFAEKNKEAATGFTAAVKKVLAKIKAFFENLMFGHGSRTLRQESCASAAPTWCRACRSSTKRPSLPPWRVTPPVTPWASSSRVGFAILK